MIENREIFHDDQQIKKNEEEFQIIWLDANIDQSDDSMKTKKILLQLNPAARFYTNSDHCIQMIEVLADEQILLIISGSFARIVLPIIHSLQSILAIFIFCNGQEQYESLKSDFKKIVAIVVDQEDLLQSIRQILHRLEQQALTFSLFDQKQKAARDLSKESAGFLLHQLLLHVLQRLPRNEQSKEELLVKCEEYYRFDSEQMNMIERFRSKYSSDKAIEWYTEECFLYKLVNKALRSENIELIYAFRFFIIDLCLQIKKEHSKLENKKVFSTYRGQRISIEELKRWRNNINTYISINGFFSTSCDPNISLKFARQTCPSDDFPCVLFEIEVDPSINSTIYADIRDIGRHTSEQEILFNLNSLFQIISIESNSIDDIWRIKLKTTDKGTRDVEEHLKSIQQEIDECSPIIYFGWLLLHELGQVNQAEKYFQMLLKTLPSDHPDFASVYNGIGRAHSERNHLRLALENYEIALKIRQERLPSNHLRIAASLHNIANIRRERGQLEQAFDYYRQALTIEESHHPGDHLQKAIIIQNIGNTYTKKNDFDIALEHLQRAYDMFQRILPEKHPKISICISNIGLVYENKGDLQEALRYYHKVLEIDEYCLPSDHPHLTKDLQTIASTYKRQNQIVEGYKFCGMKLINLKKTSGNNHPRIPHILMTMASVIETVQFEQALRLYEEALTNFEESRPIDKRAIGKCLHYTGLLYWVHSKFEEALEKLLKALHFYRDCLPNDHINIAEVCEFIGLYYRKTNRPLEALQYCNESLSIYRANYEADHEKVKLLEGDIARLNGEQRITNNNTETVEENSTNGQQTPQITIELGTEVVDNEQIVPVIIAQPLSLSAVDSLSTPRSDQNEPTPPVKKRKLCRNCEIL